MKIIFLFISFIIGILFFAYHSIYVTNKYGMNHTLKRIGITIITIGYIIIFGRWKTDKEYDSMMLSASVVLMCASFIFLLQELSII